MMMTDECTLSWHKVLRLQGHTTVTEETHSGWSLQ